MSMSSMMDSETFVQLITQLRRTLTVRVYAQGEDAVLVILLVYGVL